MATLKTQANDGNIEEFLNNIEPTTRQHDARLVLSIMREVTGEDPKMWGTSIVGFGQYHYRYESGREGEWFRMGFSPRKQNLTLYIMNGFQEYSEILARLGKYKTGKACLYINKLVDIDIAVFRELIEHSLAHLNKTYPQA